MVLRVLDLYSGSGSIAKALSPWAREFQVVQVELHPDYALAPITEPPPALEKHLVADAMALDPAALGHFDIVWASPPCRTYSALQYRWRNAAAREDLMRAEGDPLVRRALDIIAALRPTVWFLENPRGGQLRNRPFMRGLPYHDVSYCHFGPPGAPWPYRKDTRIWTDLGAWPRARVCARDCPASAHGGKHSGGVIFVRKEVRGQVPPALIRALFSAAAVKCTMARVKETESDKQAAAIRQAIFDGLKAHGVPETSIDVLMSGVGDIRPPQKTPKRVDLQISVNGRNHRGISSAVNALRSTLEDLPEDEPEPVVGEEPESEVKDEPENEPAAPPAGAVQDTAGKEIHLHFHLALPQAVLGGL